MAVNSPKQFKERFDKFFKVFNELKAEFTDFDLIPRDYKDQTDLVLVTDSNNVYLWINIANDEQYIREALLSMLVDDVQEYLNK